MGQDAEGSRREEGCLTFDLLQCQANPNTYYFYEMYADADAVAKHKDTEHYKMWAKFKEEGGVVSQEVVKAFALDTALDRA